MAYNWDQINAQAAQGLAPKGPGIGEQLATKAATNLAAKEAAKLGLGAAGTAVGGPVGAAAGTALGELAGPLAGQLVGSLFNKGGDVPKKSSIWDSVKKAASYAWKNDNLRDPKHSWSHVGQNKKTLYKNIGGMTPGPLGMSDMLMAGKDKDISKVKLKKTKGDMSEEMEYNYHAPLAAKPTTGE